MTQSVPPSSCREPERIQEPSGRTGPYWWPAIVALVGPSLLVAGTICCGLNFFWRLYGIRAVLGLWALAALWAARLAIRTFSRREWRAAVSALVLPVAVLLALAGPFPVVQSCEELGEFLLFRARRSDYLARVAALPDDGQPKLAIFSLGGMVWYSEAIVYDESDEVMLPPEQRSPTWTERASHLEFVCGFWARPFGGHFYWVGFFC
jgi:hypothetical protein